MSENQKQREPSTVINDTSQCNVATWFRCARTFDH